MTKKKKTLLVVLSAIAAFSLIVVLIFVIIANSKNDNTRPNAALSEWQSMINDDAPFNRIATPGAHDAGTCGIAYYAETQSRNTTELLEAGTRYFDLRVAYAGDDYRIFHGPFQGVTLDSVLTAMRNFLNEHQTEALVLDFQHFDGDAQQGTLEKVKATLGDLLIKNDGETSDLQFINQLRLKDARGKCLVFWGRATETIVSEPDVFLRNNDDGTRENSAMQSLYFGNLHKKSSQKFIEEDLPQYIQRYKESPDGMFVLQCQLTDGLFIFGPRYREATHTDGIDNYIKRLQSNENLSFVNIVMRDFVSPKKNCITLQLNLAKGIVATDKTLNYEQMLSDFIS